MENWPASTATILGQAEVFPARKPTQLSHNLRDVLFISGAGLLLMLIVFGWVYVVRRRRLGTPSARSRRREHTHRSAEEVPPEGLIRRVRRKRREQVREHRPRNPTLQETGGLPPARPEDEAPRF